MKDQDLIVIGAGIGGGNAAVAARKNGFAGRIRLIGAEPDPPYDRPPLSKGYLRGEEDFSHIQSRPESEYAKYEIDLRKSTRVAAIEAGRRVVRLDSGEQLSYSSLIVATGGRNRRPRIPGIDLDGVLQLRRREDSDRIRQAAKSGGRAVVIGLGFIGSEVTASLRMLGCEVAAVELERWPLARALSEEVGRQLAEMHKAHGVELVLGDGVDSFQGTDGRLRSVRTTSGRVLNCDFAVIGLGIEPEVDLLKAAGADIDDGVLVDERCRTSLPSVFAAGDCANRIHPLFGRRMRIEHWNNADRMGRFAGRNAAGKDKVFDDVPSFWSDQYDEKIEYIGHHVHFDRMVVRGDLAARKFFGFYIENGIIQAVVAMGYSDAIVEPVEKLIRYRQPIPEERLSDDPVQMAEMIEHLRSELS
jgi:3-phenylpropionate/trans-cinnamate dioxygenase ferredoxin reductase subunit